MNNTTINDISGRNISLKDLLKTEGKFLNGKVENKFAISTNLLPYMKDHRFNDMTVLPGSAYIEMALSAFEQNYYSFPTNLKNIKFNNLITLSEEQKEINVIISDDKADSCKILIHENITTERSENENSNSTSIEFEKVQTEYNNPTYFRFEEFITTSEKSITAESFYQNLEKNGNQYGKSFRNINKIWVGKNEALAVLKTSDLQESNKDQKFFHPAMFDSFMQVLSSLSSSKAKTFILTEIEEIKIYNFINSDNYWCHTEIFTEDSDENGFVGNVNIYDSGGVLILECKKVKFKYIENSGINSKKELCIASTFTVDPIEDTINFWSDYFSYPSKIKITPYNQIFQQLLNSESEFSNNRTGYNIILLNLEDWCRGENKLSSVIELSEQEKLLKNFEVFSLPGNIKIAHLNKYETEYVYKEIFIDECYLRNGISINDGDTVIDIGANIGLFSLFVTQQSKNSNIYAFEPSPLVYDILKTNSTIYNANIQSFNLGVAEKKKEAEFTFYKKSSVFSGFNTDEFEDKEAISEVVKNMLNDIDDESMDEYVNEIIADRVDKETFKCNLISVSDIIEENNLNKIDLLKIDAEKSELGILRGIQDTDWKKIKQIVIEVHDKTGEVLNEIKSILISKNFRISVEEERLLKNSGLFNIYGVKNKENGQANNDAAKLNKKEKLLEENIKNFQSILKTFIRKSEVPTIVAVCPVSPEGLKEEKYKQLFNRMEDQLHSKLNDIENVQTISSDTLLEKYKIECYFDDHTNTLGHIPYTKEFYASLGSTIFRNILSKEITPFKVIVLDCDNTLWKGVCGEDGVDGLKISEHYQYLQKFCIEKMNAGMLLCLCSKNIEDDVFDVFKKRDDMVLNFDHLVAWKINWQPKSLNIKSLSKELNLGLDSFIFLDDNPVECAEVTANCPGVLALQIPSDESQIPDFLNNIWALDNNKKATEVDKNRTKMYRENIKREEFHSSTVNLKEFLDGLNLDIKIADPTKDQLPRVAQLTHRTNQFNITTIRRSESDILKLLHEKEYKCLVTEVNDRFGNYGLVGVLIYKIEDEKLYVDTFLLSCRVLGRGVEYKILSELASIALQQEIKNIEIPYLTSPKNQPALDFLNTIGKKFKKIIEGGYEFSFPAIVLNEINYNPSSDSELEKSKNVTDKKNKISKKNNNQILENDFNINIQKVAEEYQNLQDILKAVEQNKMRDRSISNMDLVEPGNDLEKEISNIWQSVLSINLIGVNDNFFEIGGTSLKAVQLLAGLKKQIKSNVSIVDLYEFPTIKSLAEKIQNTAQEDFSTISQRGAKRRESRIIRKKRGGQ